jgi:hypothetical protein
MADRSKKTVSSRPSSRLSFRRSVAMATVVMPMPPGAATGPGAGRAGVAGAGVGVLSADGGQH